MRSGEDVHAFAVVRPELAAFERLFAGVVSREHRFVMRIPLRREIKTALLDPALKVLLGNVIRAPGADGCPGA